MLSILWSVIIGLIVGALARFIIPGKEKYGCIFTIILGVVGALLFTFIGRALGLYEEGESAGFIGAFIGAVILLLIYRFIRRENA